MTSNMIQAYANHGIQIRYVEKRINSGTLVGMLVRELTTAEFSEGDVVERAAGGDYTVEKSLPVTPEQAEVLRAVGLAR